ncbi:open rectifier potassium channel protein 1 [Halyomorpha halys]|uniref:open rectifier potassium channel protein 1 n=1 Tax=Halyomorpha halys TaxID=286706 RepID=UPI0006D516F1|nr:open rectifier potassium channel protein 1 [Halyomorpha halys]
MSKRRWFVLWLFFIAYLFLGATIFYTIERGLEEEKRSEKLKEDSEIESLLLGYCFTGLLESDNKERSAQTIITRVSNYCGKPIIRTAELAEKAEPYKWTFYNSFFFSLTTLSTIGYGNLSPTSYLGKICVIIYSLIGIPLNGIVLTHLGEFFGSKFLRAHHRYKNHTYESRFTLILDILVYLLPGMGVFILIPSVIFQIFEGWPFIDSIYFSFVSLTTIGYGDLVAGQTATNTAGEFIYQIFLVIWIMFGLGYLVMILGFISRAMRSKHINKLERKVANTLRQTQSKIWNEFVTDMNYLRRVLNELYLMKVKPVYKAKMLSSRPLSYSCPNLSEWPVLRPKHEIELDLLNTEVPKRRRAMSENERPRLQRVFSDGALQGIDRQATFSGPFDPSGLFISSAFGPGSDSDSEECKDGGIHGFSDEEILASEDPNSTKNSADMTWSIGGVPLRRQGRAMSDAQFVGGGLGQQKTWAGAESLRQFAVLRNMRAKSNEWPRDQEMGIRDLEPPRSGLRRLSIAAINFFSPTSKLKKKAADIARDSDYNKKRRSGSNYNKLKHRLSLQEQGPDDMNDIADQLNYLTHTSNRRPSILDLFATPHGTNTPISPVLEQTSIADFIRAVNSLKTYQMEASRSSSPTSVFPGNLFQAKEPRNRTKSTVSMEYNVPKERRHSQLPQMGPSGDGHYIRRRAASISPMYPLVNPLDRRLKKVSAGSKASPLSSGRATPTRFPPPPSVVVTSPDGRHRFSIHTVESPRSYNYKDKT